MWVEIMMPKAEAAVRGEELSVAAVFAAKTALSYVDPFIKFALLILVTKEYFLNSKHKNIPL